MKILMTGGTGLIGRALSAVLCKSGHQVNILSRKGPGKLGEATVYTWNPGKEYIDEKALEGVEAIVHLAGENIGSGRWTSKRKQAIVNSRTQPLELLLRFVQQGKLKARILVSSSGIAYYGGDTSGEMTELSGHGRGFLTECTIAWEAAARLLAEAGNMRLVLVRTGLVLSADGGVLPFFAQSVKWGLGAVLGGGKQWMSWIHIDDLVHFYRLGIEEEGLSGIYNLVAPHPVTNGGFTGEVAAALKKKIFFPAVPAFLIRTILGEMSVLLLGSNFVRCKRIEEDEVMTFRYPYLDEALRDLFK